MKPLRVEVEPLSEERWTKVERSLFARLPLVLDEGAPPSFRQRSPMWLAAVAVASALALVLVLEPWSSDEVALDQPSRVTTGETASHLALPGLTLDVEPESAVVVGADTQRGMLLVLDRGTIVCRVAKRANADPVIVQAGAARVRVVGTRFAVTRLGESARVEVFEGVVEVTFGGESTRVTAGQVWPDRAVALAPKPEDPSTLDTVLDVEPPESDRVPHEPTARRRSALVPRGSTEERAEAPETTPPEQNEPPPVAPSSQSVFERATALEQSDPARASQLYASLQSGNDSWAQNALYARGRLEASRGNRDLGRRLLQRYLERFPRGSNAEDARAVLGRLR
jgi:hypothetical protein